LIDQDTVPVADAVRAALDVAVAKAPPRIVVAVSGGRDSMALMHALARWHPAAVAAVATFDHGSGPDATDAAALVAAEARRLGLTVIRERARGVLPTEDAWRTARWAFLKRVARAYRAVVATAHTRDDQLETIVLRLLRGTGARGLAALAAPSTVVRPWLPLARAEVAEWGAAERVPFVDDPTNHTRRYFRSRVRLDLLPALEAVHPGFGEAMLAIGERAAEWRRGVEVLVDALPVTPAAAGAPAGSVRVPVEAMERTDDAGRAVLWPALLARVGVPVNRRGTAALVRFTNASHAGHRLELAGGASVIRVRETGRECFEVRAPHTAAGITGLALPRHSDAPFPARFLGWRFKSVSVNGNITGAAIGDGAPADDLWLIPVESGTRYDVRTFSDGDRIRTRGAPSGRRVARYLSEARIPPTDRREWPVVLRGNEIVWVPGVCRSSAVPPRSGRPAVTWYRCEREHG
jgi:tRNA(Ile)-lysidine synthase